MKKRNLLIPALAVALVSSLTVGFTFFNVSAAEENFSAIANEASGVEFIQGAQLRVDEEDDGITSARFEAVIDAERYESLVKDGEYLDGMEMGFAIVPEFAFADFDKSTGYDDYFDYFSSLGNDKDKISSVIKPSEIYPYKKIVEEDGTTTYTKYIARAVIALNKEHYAWKYRSFVYYVLDGKTYYSKFSDSRSVVCLADAVLANDEYKAKLTSAQTEKIQKITDKNDAVSGHILNENGKCEVCGEETRLTFDSIEEFSALTSLPKLIESVTIDLTGKTVDLSTAPVIGNNSIADNYSVKKTADLSEEEKSLVVEERSQSGDVILNTAKKSFTLTIKNGTMLGTDVTGLSDSKAGFVVKVPDGCDVISDGVTFNKAINVSAGWDESFASTVRVHSRKNFTFRNCKFESAALIRDGHFSAENLTFDGCSFSLFENALSDNERNPLWIQNIGKCNVVIKNCKFETVRPIKVIENDFAGATLTVTNNEFTLGEDAKNKNAAIYFPDKGDGLGNVLIEGNVLKGGTALIAFRNADNIGFAEGATFVVNDNELNGAVLSVKWYGETLYVPDFVTGNMVADNLADLSENKDAFTYGNTVTENISIDGKGVIIKKWQDLWVTGKITVKNVVFAQGVTFNANADDAGVTLENCAFNACDFSRITADRKDNSGAEYCLDFETRGKNDLEFSVVNSTMTGENEDTVYADFELKENYYKKRGHAVAVDMAAGCQTETTLNYSLTVENCVMAGVRGNAVQLYGGNVGTIVLRNTKIVSWGVNDGTTHDGKSVESAAIRGDYSSSGNKTISIENVTFGLDEGGLLKHINVGSYEGNTDGTQKAGTYSVICSAGEEMAEKLCNVADEVKTVKAIVNGGVMRLKGTNVKTKGKEVVVIGKNGAKYDATAGSSASPDGSFSGASVSFKKMTIDFGTQTFNGFVDAAYLGFDDCTLNGMMTYIGAGKSLFENCKFYSGDYNLWLYAGTSFVFKNCYFQSDIGKYLNGYRQQAPAEAIEFTLENCVFEESDIENKKPVYIKNTAGAEWCVTVTNVTYRGKNSATETDKSFFYTLAENTFKSTSVTIDGVVAVKDGKVVENA